MKDKSQNQQIVEHKKGDKYNRFLHWYAMPKSEKKQNDIPSTLEEYIKKTNTTREEIISYRDKPQFVNDVADKALAWGKSKTREILHWAYEVVKNTRTMENMDAFVDLLSKLEDKQQASGSGNINANNVNFVNVNEEQYRQIIGRESRVIEDSSQEETT